MIVDPASEIVGRMAGHQVRPWRTPNYTMNMLGRTAGPWRPALKKCGNSRVRLVELYRKRPPRRAIPTNTRAAIAIMGGGKRRPGRPETRFFPSFRPENAAIRAAKAAPAANRLTPRFEAKTARDTTGPYAYRRTIHSAINAGFSAFSRSTVISQVTCTPPSKSSTALIVLRVRIREPEQTGWANRTRLSP